MVDRDVEQLPSFGPAVEANRNGRRLTFSGPRQQCRVVIRLLLRQWLVAEDDDRIREEIVEGVLACGLDCVRQLGLGAVDRNAARTSTVRLLREGQREHERENRRHNRPILPTRAAPLYSRKLVVRELLPQFPLQYLAGGANRQRVDEFDGVRHPPLDEL